MKVKNWIIMILIILGLFLFFYPKNCGSFTSIVGGTLKDCTCIGLKYSERVEGAGNKYCVGLPIAKKCYELIGGGEKKEISCN
ncbi:hypothetical protein KY332_02025 [Candidatus Woesearchaeota archaeon]|nr:hypothetical protein [Candidatus Woesearchaeota archaeon]